MMKAYRVKDFVTIGIFSALIFVVFMGVASLTAVLGPILHVFSVCVSGFFCASIFLIVSRKVPKFGVMTLTSAVLMTLFSLMGGGYLPWVISVLITAFIADLILTVTGHESRLGFVMAIGVMMIGHSLGNIFPVLFFAEKFKADFVSRGIDVAYMEEMVSVLSGPMAAVVLVAAFVCAALGALIGFKWLSKHFKTAGMI